MASAMGGLISITGPEDGPPCKVGVAITDVSAGTLLQGAITAALFARERTGRGQKLDTSLLEAQVFLCHKHCYNGLGSYVGKYCEQLLNWRSAT
jgi:succinate--hydroxymethylglutarate CoA-transferase